MLPHQEKVRYLTIQGRSREVRCRGYDYNIPELRLTGLWMAEQGFYPSKKVKIIVRKDVLVIQLIQEEEIRY